ncbi:MAG: xanthine dehydrogenase family protein subunit M [Rhodospirillales bacterium]|nr:xanthine dehydrogenase family protein subunit M [Rhodospirillales bacterium]
MYAFNYQCPQALAEAVSAFTAADDATWLAGGQTLVPVLKQHLAMPSDLIDLASIAELKGISVAGNRLSIGAMTCHAEVAGSPHVRGHIPALAELAGMIGDPHVRNRGTLGGSIANNDPAADYPAALLALDAVVHTNKRQIAADAFFTDLFETALDEGELILRVDFPLADKAAYEKFANPASRYAVVGVFAACTGNVSRIAVTGAGPCVFRADAMEQALNSSFTAAAIAGITADPEGLNSDMHASAVYRAHLIGVLAGRAINAANARGNGQ